jgi:hypothetical protein
MSHASLAAVYFTVGIACGAFVYARGPDRGARTAASALAAALIWPLWAPFALAVPQPHPRGAFADRIAKALEDGGSPGAGTTAGDKAELVRQVELAEHRLTELDARIAATRRARCDADVGAAGLGETAAPAPPVAPRIEILDATIHRLEMLRAREFAALVELADLCELLRAQLLFVRLGGSGRVLELRDELLARVQVLNEVGG